jgi:hypothetical protein
VTLFSFLFILFFGANAFAGAGTVDGGGGKAIVCRDPNNKIIRAQTFDLFEGAAFYNLNLTDSSDPLDQQIARLEVKMLKTMDQPEFQLIPRVERARSILRVLQPGIKLSIVDDAAILAAPTNCTIEQLAHYVDETLLLVDGEIWDALDNTNKAALIAHEAVYDMERVDDSATDSRRSRKFVAYLFSDFNFIPVREGVPYGSQLCDTMEGVGADAKVINRFFLFPNSSGSTLQFIRLRGQWVFDKKVAKIALKMPWNIQDPFGSGDWNTTFCGTGSAFECNFAGGSIDSGFEGNDFITIGYEQRTLNGETTSDFFINDGGVKHPIQCSSAGS